MDVATFCEFVSEPCERFRSRVLTGVSALDETAVRAAYGDGFERVKVGDFVTGERFVIMPPALFQELDDRFEVLRRKGKVPILSGLDVYLELLDRENRKNAFGFLLRFVNKTGLESVVAILRWDWSEMHAVFSHPSLAENDWISLSSAVPAPSNVAFVPKRFASRFPEGSVLALDEWLNWRMDGGTDCGESVVAVKFNSGPFPGLDGAHVSQIPDARSFLGTFCGLAADRLDDGACDWILANTETRNIREELARRFFPNGLDGFEKRVLSRWRRISDADEKAVFLEFVSRHAAPGGYLSRALARTAVGTVDFTEAWLRPSEDDLVAPNAVALAKERWDAIRELDAGAAISVESAQDIFLHDAVGLTDGVVAPWMGLGLDCEEREWVRRYIAGSKKAAERCRRLRAYLAQVGTGVPSVDVYLRGYRERKAANRIDVEFCKLAGHEELPGAELDDRDAEIKKAAADAGAFLLVVDGLGAEWIPFLVTLANEHGVQIATAKCVKTLLPTSTEFNPTSEAWGDDARYRKFDDLDKIYHKKGLTPAEGLCMEFAEVENVLKQVRELLVDWERVVVSADHGASRLSVLAYENGMAATFKPGENGIPAGIEPKKWRFAWIPKGTSADCVGLETTLSGEWACVRGYGRFSISGGPTFELHGGATPEERLAPWIVFQRGFSSPFRAEEAQPSTAAPFEDGQIEVDSDFDI